jgi:hypothetical protein
MRAFHLMVEIQVIALMFCSQAKIVSRVAIQVI